jgi:hypothetical protein
MRHWKSMARRSHGVWTSEVRLKTASTARVGKVNKLLKLLKEDVRES